MRAYVRACARACVRALHERVYVCLLACVCVCVRAGLRAGVSGWIVCVGCVCVEWVGACVRVCMHMCVRACTALLEARARTSRPVARTYRTKTPISAASGRHCAATAH